MTSIITWPSLTTTSCATWSGIWSCDWYLIRWRVGHVESSSCSSAKLHRAADCHRWMYSIPHRSSEQHVGRTEKGILLSMPKRQNKACWLCMFLQSNSMRFIYLFEMTVLITTEEKTALRNAEKLVVETVILWLAWVIQTLHSWNVSI